MAAALAFLTCPFVTRADPPAPHPEAAPSATPPSVNPIPFPRGGLLDLLPRASELGPDWSDHLDLLVDPRCQPPEYFPPSVPPATVATLRQRLAGQATCQMRYHRGPSIVFEAWLTRLRNPEEVANHRRHLAERLAAPTDDAYRHRTVRLGGREARIIEGRDGSTVWIDMGSHVLSLNLPAQSTVSDDFLKIAALFAKRIAAPAKEPNDTADVPTAAANPTRRVVQATPDLHVPIEDGSQERVYLSAPRQANTDSACYFSITNAGTEPIVVWNVRVQSRASSSGTNEAPWVTLTSDYPSSVATITPGTIGVERVAPPDHVPWRLCLIYTKQTSLGTAPGAPAPRSLGEFELVSAPITRIAP